jgi:uncharacterized repeat protein (TIGR01451 family)
MVSAESTLRVEADPSSTGARHQQVTEPLFQLSVRNSDGGSGDTTAYRVQLLISVPDPDLLAGVEIEGNGLTTALTPDDLENGTPVYSCSGRPVPPHGIYPAHYAVVDLGDITAGASADTTVIVTGDDGLAVHFEAIAEGFRQQGNSTVCRDVSAPSGHHVTAVLGAGGSVPAADCEAGLDTTSDVDAVVLGEQVVFTLTAINPGDCELSSVVVTNTIPIVVGDGGDQHPAFTVYDVDPDTTSVTETEIVWALDDLPVAKATVATVTVAFDDELADGLEVVNAACLTAAELDAPVCDNAVVTVGDSARPEPVGGPGFWCRQIRASLEGRPDGQYRVDELAGWLSDVNVESWAFTELYDTSTLDFARTLLCRPNTLTVAADRLARHLLGLSLNLAAERVEPEVTLTDLCASSEQPPDNTDPAWTVGFVHDQAEDVLMAGDDDATLLFWMDVIDFVNSSSVPEACGPAVRRPRGPRRLTP